MKLEKELEEKIKSKAIEYLKNGKPDWDIPHTICSVYRMKKLIRKEKGNEKILATAMYLHDIGYPKLKKGYDFEDLMKAKEKHAKIGAMRAKKILNESGKYSQDEIKKIADLVKHHDNRNKLDSHDRILVMEADGLAQIDWKKVKPTFDKKNCITFLKYFKEKRATKFQTQTGKKFLSKLLKEAEEYLSKMH